MGLYVAPYPSGEATAHLEAALAEVRESFTTEHASHIRWIPPERWHITLAFLAHVDCERVDRLQRALADVAAEHAPLVGLGLTGASAFGSTLWVGLAPTERGSAAERLAKATQRAARTCSIEVERRPWLAHLSIARVRGDRDQVRQVTREVASSLSAYDGPLWTASHVTLVHSILGPQPQHTPVDTFALA